jgi:phage major head subunit gpT-like protein
MISGQVPNHLVYGARAGFLQALKSVTPQWSQIASVVNMDRKSVDLVDLGAAPMPKESGAGITIQDFIEKNLTIKPKDWDITVFITHNAMRDDQTGTLDGRVRGAGQNFQKHIDKLVFQALNGGDAATYGLCYDGQYFFDTDHVDKGGNYQTSQVNKGAVSLTLDNFETAWVAASQFLDDQGEIVGFVPNLLVVPPAYKREAAQIADNALDYGVANNAINPFSGQTRYIVSPYLDSTSWFLIAANESIKPIMVIMREQPNLQDAWFDPAKPDGGHYYFKFYARYYVAYSDWRTAWMGNT